ncbi:MAG TPA: hypothetical protein H9729_02795 [Candidatus Borkfalkia excrementigallinarum]|uniref:Uncharacterized protein n=1 Tax=Candidatus Borkfalkia excrementigallinarum TaxID=2838506 RepID=A0A9D1ZZ30_9FIRM|nr:hypothetical protein [Candidatus Borkfalkia excrementigallinarum]
MRAKWPILLKIQLMGLTGINRAKKSNDPRDKRKTAGGIVAIAVVGAVVLFYAAMLAVGFCEQGLGKKLPALIVALSSVIIFAFTLFQGSSILFATKDYDMVMSLPIPRWEVVLARLLCSYIVNFAFALAVAVPVTAVYFAYGGFTFGALGTILLSVIMTPLLPLAVSAALSTLIAALTARLRFKNLLQSILGIALFVGVMIASFSFSFNANADGEADMASLFGMLVGKIYPPAWLVDMTLSGTVWGVFAFAGISLAAAALFVAIVSVFYTKINSALLSRGARAGYKAKDIRSSSAFGALVKKEIKRMFSHSGYLLNGLCGAVLLIIFGVALLFIDLESFFDIPAEDFAALKAALAPMGAGLMMLFIGMSCPAASALSLEGNSRGLLFSLPVSARLILLAKAVPTFLFDGIAGLVFAVLFGIRLGTDAFGWAALLLTAILYSAFTAVLGSFLNYKYPKYDWANETQAVKSSIPVMITVFGNMVLGMTVLVVSVFVGPWLALGIDLLCAVFCAVLYGYFGKLKLYM